jgi:dihydroxyacetone kinase
MRTVLDALVPALQSGRELLASQGEGPDAVSSVLRAMATGATHGAQSTQGMAAQAGRASYVPANQVQSVPDPGAMAVAIVLGAVAATLL